jgi:hypothetical protein
MKLLEELRQARERIGDDAVPVVGHDADGVQQHARLAGRHRQAVAHEVIGASRWFQQELPLGAAPREQIRPPRQDLPRCCHRALSANGAGSCEVADRLEVAPFGEAANHRWGGDLSTADRGQLMLEMRLQSR